MIITKRQSKLIKALEMSGFYVQVSYITGEKPRILVGARVRSEKESIVASLQSHGIKLNPANLMPKIDSPYYQIIF